MKDNILLWGRHGVKNYGDDALMCIGVNILKQYYGEGNILIVCDKTEYIKELCPDINFVLRNEVDNFIME